MNVQFHKTLDCKEFRASRQSWYTSILFSAIGVILAQKRGKKTVPNLALFDFDGTITRADTFTPFLYFSTGGLRRYATFLVLSPFLLAYRLGIVRATVARSVAARCVFFGREKDLLDTVGREFAVTQIDPVVRPEALHRIHWHQQQGDTVVVVSASLEFYLKPWCEKLAIDLICTKLEVQNGRLNGRYLNGDCTGPEKRKRICELLDLTAYATIYAYGDTKEDMEMLSLAHKKYFKWEEIPPS